MRNVTPKFSDQELFHLAEKFGTPYFLIDEAALRRTVSELEQAYQEFKGPFRVAYSIKANYNPTVIKTFVSEGIMFDLTASNELYFLLKCGGSSENVIYTSITETMAEYEQVMKLGVRKIVVSSYNGLLNLIEARTRVGEDVEVLIRVNPEVSVKAELRFSIKHGKFGVPLDSADEDSAMSLLRKILSTPGHELRRVPLPPRKPDRGPVLLRGRPREARELHTRGQEGARQLPHQDDRHGRRPARALREERPDAPRTSPRRSWDSSTA